MTPWLNTLLVLSTVGLALGFLMWRWLRSALGKGTSCSSGCFCPVSQGKVGRPKLPVKDKPLR
jgi:hypothetical protein